MKRPRKNAGEGYGYMFSGAFAKKSDAVKKEKKRKGSFVKAVMMRSGMRYAVMTPRTNPIKRKKKVVTPATNPSELLVLAANPHENREINLPMLLAWRLPNNRRKPITRSLSTEKPG